MPVTLARTTIWWKEPIERVELIWIVLAFIWGLTMFATMIVWHVVGKQNLSNEAYRIQPETFMARTEAFATKYKVREEAKTGVPVVRPPAGADVYLLGAVEWWPVPNWRGRLPSAYFFIDRAAFRCSRSTSTFRFIPATSTC
jgi:cytochrome c oxidase subunit 2